MKSVLVLQAPSADITTVWTLTADLGTVTKEIVVQSGSYCEMEIPCISLEVSAPGHADFTVYPDPRSSLVLCAHPFHQQVGYPLQEQILWAVCLFAWALLFVRLLH